MWGWCLACPLRHLEIRYEFPGGIWEESPLTFTWHLCYGVLSPCPAWSNTQTWAGLTPQGLPQKKGLSWDSQKTCECQQLMSDFIFLGSKITADGNCSHEIKRRLLLRRKVMTNLDSIFKSRDTTLPTKVHLVKAMVFPVVMYGCESWTVKKAERWRRMLLNCGVGEDSWESHGL